MNLDLGLLARALIARVMQLEQENAKLREQLVERGREDDEGITPIETEPLLGDGR